MISIPHKRIRAALEAVGAVDIFLRSGEDAEVEFYERDMQEYATKDDGNLYKYFCEVTWGCGDMDNPPNEYQLKHPHVFNGVDFATCDAGDSVEEVVKKCLNSLLVSGFDPDNDWDAPSKVIASAGLTQIKLQSIINSISKPIDLNALSEEMEQLKQLW